MQSLGYHQQNGRRSPWKGSK